MKNPITTFFYKLLLLTVTTFCLNGFRAFAQWPGYKVFPLTEDNRAIKINTLFKSNEGYIYTGTTNGLYKFDGTRFSKIYFEVNPIKFFSPKWFVKSLPYFFSI